MKNKKPKINQLQTAGKSLFLTLNPLERLPEI